MSILVSMAAFALASSITPGPVNIVALSAGARYGIGASLRHAAGATLGFVALFLLIGLGLHEALARWPALTTAIQWGGIAFLLYMAAKLSLDDGRLNADATVEGPSAATGAAMQWLNPKAWLASVAAMGAYAADGDRARVWQFAALYLVICFASIACWAYAGAALRHHLANARRMRAFNRLMAVLLAGSALYLLDA
ncbi:Lysine exporter protein (LYSE/YGGA) [Burkholderia sp. lig30]|jgi:threonine/homoserine/homoserine lactone efflux protein|uniref:LysE family translocator n=1 Tax=Burkholderia sp. lig30 TaxID=1192124 RepID=UPI000461C861|nr:LysE family translocator [Burkholderia sp. lig30]KDB10131.1 Lysine exporter protein (LYSE/YGGA) [Burkholderia sp. lig30]